MADLSGYAARTLVPANERDIEDLPEPMRTQELLTQQMGGGAYSQQRRDQAKARQDLRRVPGPDAADFHRDNPDADIYDYQRWMQQGGRWQGNPPPAEGETP